MTACTDSASCYAHIMAVKVKDYLKWGACRVYERAHHVRQGTCAAFIFYLDWIFETGSHCSLDWSRTHCVSQTTLTPLQSSCFSLPSSGMTGIGHHAQLEHPQIFIPKGGPEINPWLPPWDTCVCLICSLILEVPAFSENTRLRSSIASKPPRNCSSFPEQFCLFTLPAAARGVQFLHILVQACALHSLDHTVTVGGGGGEVK